MIVPTLRVGMQPGTLRVPRADAERPLRHSHAERGNEHLSEDHRTDPSSPINVSSMFSPTSRTFT